MSVALQITFKDMEPAAGLEARIRQKAEALERFEKDILRCHVTLEAPHQRHRQGQLYRARIEVFVPRGEVLATREGSRDHAHEDAYVAVRDAFDAIVRQLEDHVRKLGQQVKRHEAPQLHGRVARFEAEQGYGFIETSEGEEVYFHRNSLPDGAFDRLRVGDEVRLVAVEGEKGLQASTVHRVGKHHPVP